MPVARAVAWRSLHNYFRNPALLVPSVVFPLIFLAAFAGGLSAVGDVPGFGFPAGYTAFQFVFVLLQAAAFGGVFTAFSVAADFEIGIAQRLLLAAADRRGILLGYVASALVRFAFVAVIVTVVALVAGMDVTGSGVDVVGLYALATLVNVAAYLYATGIAMRFRSIQAGPLMQTPVFLILFLAPVYVPLDLLRGWIKPVAQVNPASLLLEAGRGLISGEEYRTALAFGAAACFIALALVWALGGLRSAERAE